MSARGGSAPPPLPVFAEDAFPSRTRHPWLVVRLGAILGVAITVCFVTGIVSHLHQHPLAWLPLPAGPVWGYRVNQGLHVATGLASIPIFVAKLWSVYPHLFTWPAVRDPRHALERLSVGLLAAATGFELVTGVLNLAHLYLWSFLFPVAHYAVAWVVVGSVLLHLAVKWPLVVQGWKSRADATVVDDHELEADPAAGAEEAVTRRAVLWGSVAAAAAITTVTVGQSLRPLGWAGLLAPRSPQDVPTGIPINRTAASAGVLVSIVSDDYRLRVGDQVFTLAQLSALPQVEVELPIACVEGWSASGVWGGVRLRDLLDLGGIPQDATVRAVSLEAEGLYSSAEVTPSFSRHPDTLLALRLGGQVLSHDHGYPVRLIAPNRPGVLQTKWVSRVEIV